MAGQGRRITVYVDDATDAELKAHPGLNRAALFREAVARYFRQECNCPHHAAERAARVAAEHRDAATAKA